MYPSWKALPNQMIIHEHPLHRMFENLARVSFVWGALDQKNIIHFNVVKGTESSLYLRAMNHPFNAGKGNKSSLYFARVSFFWGALDQKNIIHFIARKGNKSSLYLKAINLTKTWDLKCKVEKEFDYKSLFLGTPSYLNFLAKNHSHMIFHII